MTARKSKDSIYAVITGDVVDSQMVVAPSDWLEPLKSILNQLGRSPRDWEVFRGDSFQMQLADPLQALSSALRIKAALRQHKDFDVRVGIGLGTISHSARRISERQGEAFIRAGACFEGLRLEKRRLALRSPWPQFNEDMDLYLLLASTFMDAWPPMAAEVAGMMLAAPELKQDELAKRLSIAQSSVSERLSRVRWNELQALLAMYHKKLKAQLL